MTANLIIILLLNAMLGYLYVSLHLTMRDIARDPRNA